MEWFAAMGVALPLCWSRALWSPRMRTWLVVMGSSLATYLHPWVPFGVIEYYLMICLVGAAVTLAYPMTNWQRFIGWIYIAMAGLNIGFLLGVYNSSSAAFSLDMLSSYQHLLGWAMVATLFCWGGYDGLRGVGVLPDFLDSGAAASVEHEA